MAETKRIVVLANSRKLGGRCLAGIEWERTPPTWVRPVSARASQELSFNERRYVDGTEPGLLDIVDVSLLGHQPSNHQFENWLLDTSRPPKKIGTAQVEQLDYALAPPSPFWTTDLSTHAGINDRIASDAVDSTEGSLRLLEVPALVLKVSAAGADFGNSKRRVQGRFNFAGEMCWTWVTDPGIEEAYLAKPDGTYTIRDCVLTLSLGEEHEGYCYKFIAGVIPREDG